MMKAVLRVVMTAAVAAMLVHTACAQSAASPAAAAPPPILSDVTPATADASPFPAVDPHQFTSSFPTKDTVASFLKQMWGYDPNRIFQIAAIQKTDAADVARVYVLVAERGQTPDQVKTTAFLVLSDGKHAIAGDAVMDFGATPFAAKRALLQSRATGPWRGGASKDLELVEFADLQCPHCKEANATMDKLAQDFPSAHIVFQNFPLVAIHNAAYKAAAYSLCVAQMSPENQNAAFFSYISAVFDTQDALTPDNATQTLDNAVVKAGLDSAKVAACADTQPIKDALKMDIDLANDADVNSTPTLFVNGRAVPVAGVEYDTLKNIINYQAALDGVTLPPPAAAPSN